MEKTMKKEKKKNGGMIGGIKMKINEIRKKKRKRS